MSPWWRGGVLYQIYPRSFADSDGDGVGDLAGIRARLDYLEWLGVDGIWLNPVTPSPNDDWGYDVSDYLEVHPDLGTLADLDALVADAAGHGIRVLLDLVPNHTSDRHPWFSDPARRDWYVWTEAPNNWLSAFGGSAWTYHEQVGRHYLHSFLASQPDLNWWNEAVRDEFDRILRFWFDRGIAGFRIDVAHRIVKDERLRDNLPVTEDDHPHIRALGQRQTYSANQPEVHEVLRRWRRIADAYESQRVLIGETYVLDPELLASYYGADADELNLAFNFLLVHSPFEAAELAAVVAATEASLPETAWPVWTGSNHDAGRFPTRWCDGDEAKARCALVALLALRGTPVLYYGDELGLPNVEVPRERLRDPVGMRAWPEQRGRDPGRTPMQWSAEPGGGFTSAAEPWLPLGDHRARNVAAQRGDPASMLSLARDLIRLRRETADLRDGGYVPLGLAPGVWAWRRGETALVALNLSGSDKELEVPAGEIAIGTDRGRDGELVSGTLSLRAAEAAVLRLSP